MATRRSAVVLALVAGLVACDRLPVDPSDPEGGLAALLLGTAAGDVRTAPLSLPGLLQSAIHRVYTEQGSEAARAVVGDLRRLQDEARLAAANGQRETAAVLQRAVHAEEIRIVLAVFGPAVVPRVRDGVAADAARLSASVAELEGQGRLLPRAHELLAQVRVLLADVAALQAADNVAAALDAATRAAGAAESVRHVVLDAARIATLETLFDDAVTRLRLLQGPEAARAALARFNALEVAAQREVRAGERERAHAALKAVRDEQIRIVVRVLGVEAVRRQLAEVRRGLQDADAALARARDTGRDVYRLERMTVAAREIHFRALEAADAGDLGTALDLGSHAASLINALRVALTAA